MKTWVCDSGQKLEIFIPFLGKYRPLSGRCCQTCTPKSWDGFHHQHLSSLGFRDAVRVTEEDTRYRGWLVRRVCGFLAVWGWKVPADTPGDLPARICCSRRVRGVATGRSRGSRGDGESHRRWKEKALEVLSEIQAPLSLLLLRLCNWALLKLLGRLFLSVQLHRGQLETVLGAARTVGNPAAALGPPRASPPAQPRPLSLQSGVPLVFLSMHKSQLDGLLLSFLLFSQGLGVPRVTVGDQPCSPRLRALLGRLGGIFLPSRTEQTPSSRAEGLPGAVLAAYVEEVLRSRQPLLIFLEEPPVALRLSAPARQWLTLVYRAVRDGAVPDVLLVPVGIAYDLVPGGSHREGTRGARTLGACLWAACRAVRQNLGCARVDFAQPFSLQEFAAKTLVRQSRMGKRPEELLLPAILGTCPVQPGSDRAEVWGPGPATAAGAEEEEEMLVTALGLHCLSDGVACSAVMAVGITSALLLHKHREGVFLSRLMLDFAWLLEEILLRQRDVGFSGQLRALVQHSLVLLGARLTLYRLSPVGDVLVVPEASAEALRELDHHSAAILPVFASEAVGACAIRALLMEMLPFLGATVGPSGIVLSQDELHRKTLELLRLLPPNLLGLQPCQPLDCRSRDIVDKLLLCGLLEAEEPESERWVCDLAPRPFCKGRPWAGVDFTDSDSGSEDEVPKRCFKLSEPQGSPGFLLFLCRLLSPVLRTYARAAAFLERPGWPQHEAAYVEALLQFLAEEDGFEQPNRSLALSSLQTFKEMGVLEEVRTPAGPLLHLAQPFRSGASRRKLEAFIQQFAQP
ncbi:glycerol-3-phosphate acyltransferase 2, mitochondrial-like isoform X2 [Balearica regulorum gibbericeps]|uniref:glycerol-3-phosphate acyltransferase 2, mitochondrial-like isoform X2 n=1 Tax=Balearica regulorum gibbericeps TaxID=100784 RepID=UPI003F625557